MNIPVFGKKYTGNPVGLGDVLKKTFDALGIEACLQCKARQQALNRLVQFTKVGQPAPQPPPSQYHPMARDLPAYRVPVEQPDQEE